MASRKENRKMVDMLERMGMIKKDGENTPVEHNSAYPAGAGLQATAGPSPAASESAVESRPTTASSPPEPVAASPAEVGVFPRPADASAPFEKRVITASSPLSSLGDSFWDDTPAEPEAVERFMEIDELYQLFEMPVGGVDTVYLLEEYIKTLPDSLPADLRRSIIVRIVQASGFDFDKLLSDGIDRVSRLNDYAGDFAVRTDAVVTQQNETIAELERQIELVRAVINERKNLHKKQFLTIENEAQRLKKVLDFITK